MFSLTFERNKDTESQQQQKMQQWPRLLLRGQLTHPPRLLIIPLKLASKFIAFFHLQKQHTAARGSTDQQQHTGLVPAACARSVIGDDASYLTRLIRIL